MAVKRKRRKRPVLEELTVEELQEEQKEADEWMGGGCPRLRAISRSNLRKNHPKS